MFEHVCGSCAHFEAVCVLLGPFAFQEMPVKTVIYFLPEMPQRAVIINSLSIIENVTSFVMDVHLTLPLVRVSLLQILLVENGSSWLVKLVT